MAIGDNIVELRKKAGITSRDLAAAVGVTPATMSRYEHGKITVISNEMIGKIAEALAVQPEELVSGDPSYAWLCTDSKKKISSRKWEEKKLLEGFYGLSPELQDAVRRICKTGLSK